MLEHAVRQLAENPLFLRLMLLQVAENPPFLYCRLLQVAENMNILLNLWVF